MYFGSTIVFQELREKRALAYTAYARIMEPTDLDKASLAIGYIATQNDKIMDAFSTFDELYNAIPRSDGMFSVSKDALMKKISTERISRMNVIWNFLNAEKLGLDHDIREDIFRKISRMELGELIDSGEKIIRNKPKTYLVLGNEPDVDFATLEKLGPVTKLSLKDIFGY
jgi:predicted Zn-dependent peptidase